MAVVFDALGYESIGRTIKEQGWLEYFRAGPQREPFYPWTIAVSMGVADRLGVSYQFIQKIFQILGLFVTQILLWILLGKLNVARNMKLVVLLYFGFSPGLVNAALSLFSEIMVFPTVLMFLGAIVWAWRALLRPEKINAVQVGAVVALTFLLAIFNKGIFQYVFWVLLIPFGVICLQARRQHAPKVFLNRLVFLITALVIVQACVGGFKGMNKKYNGNFVFTDRYSHLLFGNAYKRSRPLTPEVFGSQVASIPGGGVCRRFFTEKQCRYSDFYGADNFRMDTLMQILYAQENIDILRLTLEELFNYPWVQEVSPQEGDIKILQLTLRDHFERPSKKHNIKNKRADEILGLVLEGIFIEPPPPKNFSEEERNSAILQLTFKEILSNPFQYVLFMGMEFPRMFFWESTQIGFVEYPKWLYKIYTAEVFRGGLRLIVSLMTIFSLIFVLLHTFRHRVRLFDLTPAGYEIQICFFVLLTIFAYAGLYSFFSIVTRYALPLGPLYLLCIAYTFSKIFSRQIYKK